MVLLESADVYVIFCLKYFLSFFLSLFNPLTPSILVLNEPQYLGLVVSGYIGIQSSLLKSITDSVK